MRLALALLSALAAAHAAAAGTFDRTLRCATELQGGVPLLQVEANAMTKSHGFWFPTELTVSTGGQTTILRLLSSNKAFTYGADRCTTATGVPLVQPPLPLVGTLHRGDHIWLTTRCFVGAHVLIHFRVAQDSSARPVSATVVVRSGTGKPLAFARWSRASVTLRSAKACSGE